MAQLDHPTVSIKVEKSNKSRRTYWRILRSIGIAFLTLIAVGWGAWKYVATNANVEDDKSSSELEGFDFATQFVKSPKTNDSLTAQMTESTMLPPLSPTELMTRDQGDLKPPSMNETTDSANAWLNGTIEAAEPVEKIVVPTRLSGGSNESSILR